MIGPFLVFFKKSKTKLKIYSNLEFCTQEKRKFLIEKLLILVCIFQGKSKQGQFALDTSVKAITYYKDFFGVSYPLPKYDCIAIADFQMGAMENWGLVTFRETAVLVDPENTSAKAKQWIAIGIYRNSWCARIF